MRILTAIIAIVLSAASSSAQEHPKIRLIKEILVETDAQGLVEKLRIDNVAQTRAAIFAQAAKQGNDPVVNRMLERAMEKYKDYSKEIFSWETLENEYVKLYDEAFTEDELQGLANFYRTDAGRASLRAVPIILSRMQQRVLSRQAETAARIDRIMRESAAEIQSEVEKKGGTGSPVATLGSVASAAQPPEHPLVDGPGQYPKEWPVSATFPAEPKVEVRNDPILTYSGRASFADAHQRFVIYRYVFPSGTHLDQEQAEASVKREFLNGENRVLERSENIRIAGSPARRLVIADTSAAGGVLDIRVLIFQNEEYQFICQRPFGSELSEEAIKFFGGIEVGSNQ